MLGQNGQPSGNASRPNVSYYDLALAVLPIPLVAGVLVGALAPLSLHVGLSAGAVVSAVALGYLLFGDPPTRGGPRGRVGGPSA